MIEFSFVVVCVYAGIMTLGYIEERLKYKKKNRPYDWHHEERQRKIT